MGLLQGPRLIARTTKSPIRRNHWVPLGCRGHLGSVKSLLNPKWILNNQSYAIVHYFCIKRPAPALRYGVCYVNLAFKLALLYRDLDRGFPRVWVHPYINTNVSILLESQVFSTFHNSEGSWLG